MLNRPPATDGGWHPNSLLKNHGGSRFADVTAPAGDPGLTSLIPNRMFRNAAGEYFQDVTSSGGSGHLRKGHGVAFDDQDHDGDQEVFEVMGGVFTGDVYQNVLFENPGHGNHWLKLELEGVQSNRDAIGARVRLQVRAEDGERTIHARVSGGSSFGASSFRREIGLGSATGVEVLEIFWPASGTRQRFENVEADQLLRIREGDRSYAAQRYPAFRLGGVHPQTSHLDHDG